MQRMLSFTLSAAILWFLLVAFHEGSNFEIQEQQAITITLIVAFTGMLIRLALPEHLTLLGLFPQGMVLYLALDKFCGYSTRTTLKIMGWFVALHLIWGLIVAFLF